MDNARLDIINNGEETFRLAMQIAFAQYSKAKWYAVHPKLGFILAWHKPDREELQAQPLPYEMSFEQATVFVWGWLKSDAASKQRGGQPDHDGDNGAGWRVYNEAWGHVGGDHYSFVAIQPIWAMYGK